ncbi:MAG: transcriptional repressor NrdR [Endomicrobiales bacterium]|nr:transcriptional repressor NrdR [Endomicrobiales bacterium]
MKCPFCGSFKDQVIDSRPLDHSSTIRRRRECIDCKKRFTTYERLEESALMVVKSDDRREPFDRQKLYKGLMTACEKRPISSDALEKIVSEVEYELQEYVMEVPSRIIGDKVLEKLWEIDLVAYIRFASVYKQFGDIDTFMDELKKMKKEHVKQNNKVKI